VPEYNIVIFSAVTSTMGKCGEL